LCKTFAFCTDTDLGCYANDHSIDAVKWLLELGLDSNLRCDDNIYRTPLLCLQRHNIHLGLDGRYRMQDTAIAVMRLLLKNPDFDPGDDDFGFIADFYGIKVIEWLLCQDYQSISQKSLDIMLHSCCSMPCDPQWEKVVRQLVKLGANIHNQDIWPWACNPLDKFLEHYWDAERWLQVLQDEGVDLRLYADREKQIHKVRHYIRLRDTDGHLDGPRRIRYAYRSDCNQVRIWLGSLVDWEVACTRSEPTLGPDPRIRRVEDFGLRYLFDGFATDEDIKRAWEQKLERKRLVESTKEEAKREKRISPSLTNTTFDPWCFIVLFVCYYYFYQL